MGQLLLPDNIPTLSVASTTSVQIAATNMGQPTRITIGGQQYALSSTLTLNTSTTGANGLDTGTLSTIQLWYVYAIVNNSTFAPALVASLNAPSTGPAMPSGYGTAYKLVGAFYTNGSSQVGSYVPLSGVAVTSWMSLSGVTQIGSSNGLAFTNCTVGAHEWRRNGTMLEVRGIVAFSGATSNGTGGFLLVMNNGFILDGTDPYLANATGPYCSGKAQLINVGGSGNSLDFEAVATSIGGNLLAWQFYSGANVTPYQFQPTASIPRATVNNDQLNYLAVAPVTIWSGKTTLL